jgi:hypothetical protein
MVSAAVRKSGVRTSSPSDLGFRVEAGDKLVLFTPGRGSVADAVVVKKTLRGRFPDATGEWRFPSESTPGLANSFVFHSDVVINELMYHSRGETAASESWLELFNRGTNTADLTDWRLDGGISFRFAPGTAILAGGYLVVAKDVEILRALHPGITVVGPFTNSLSRHSDLILLKDANGNPADEVRYLDGGRWTALADGGGSGPNCATPGPTTQRRAWAASRESATAGWSNYTYRAVAVAARTDIWKEFVLGLLDSGECLISTSR